VIKKRRCGIFFGVKATNGYKKSDTDGKNELLREKMIEKRQKLRRYPASRRDYA
jgi:hypothetical protein